VILQQQEKPIKKRERACRVSVDSAIILQSKEHLLRFR